MGIYQEAVELLESPLCEECPGRIYSVSQDVDHPEEDSQRRLNKIGAVTVYPRTIAEIARFSIAKDIVGCEGPIPDTSLSFGIACGAINRINNDSTSSRE